VTSAPGSVHAADSHDLIRVYGARENELKNVSVLIACQFIVNAPAGLVPLLVLLLGRASTLE
jgi:hypothetical protein